MFLEENIFSDLISLYVNDFLNIEENKDPNASIDKITTINGEQISYTLFKYISYKEKLKNCIKFIENVSVEEDIPILIFCIKMNEYNTQELKQFENVKVKTYENCRVEMHKRKIYGNGYPYYYRFVIKFYHKNYSVNNFKFEKYPLPTSYDCSRSFVGLFYLALVFSTIIIAAVVIYKTKN